MGTRISYCGRGNNGREQLSSGSMLPSNESDDSESLTELEPPMPPGFDAPEPPDAFDDEQIF